MKKAGIGLATKSRFVVSFPAVHQRTRLFLAKKAVAPVSNKP